MKSKDNLDFANRAKSYIIAEAGVNHDGSLEKAKKLVDAAIFAGVDAVKFQTFKTEKIVTEDTKQADYQIENLGKDEGQFKMLKRLELAESDFKEIKNYCGEKGITFLSTPHSGIWSVNILENLDIDFYKISSGDLNNKPLLDHISKLKKPIVLSTGMATMEEISETLNWIKSVPKNQIVVLHCTSSYPSSEERVNLNAMVTIREDLDCVVGYSDHTMGLETAAIATCLGSKVYEKHLTLDRNDVGPDHKASLEPNEFKKMVEIIRLIEENDLRNPKEAFEFLNSKGFELNEELIDTILGKSEKFPDELELEIAKVSRKSLVALKDLKAGETLNEENMGIRRPGEGLPPKFYGKLLGLVLAKDVKKGKYILEGDAK